MTWTLEVLYTNKPKTKNLIDTLEDEGWLIQLTIITVGLQDGVCTTSMGALHNQLYIPLEIHMDAWNNYTSPLSYTLNMLMLNKCHLKNHQTPINLALLPTLQNANKIQELRM